MVTNSNNDSGNAASGSSGAASGNPDRQETRTTSTAAMGSTTARQPSAFSGTDYSTSGRTDVDYSSTRRDYVTVEERSGPSTATVVGAAITGAIVGGAIPFMLGGRSSTSALSRSGGKESEATVTESVTVNRPARELYDFWRNFSNLPQFMDNIKSVDVLDERRSHWVIKAPAGTSVEFDSRVVDDVPGRVISWQSEEGATVPNRGRVEFVETSGSATEVRATISYDPPAGAAGRAIAKLFQREPSVQAREDLQRFKRLMETGRADG